MRANDLVNNKICSKFSHIKSQLSHFERLLTCFKMNFVKKLSEMLPKIRGTGADEKELTELISSIFASPFNPNEVEKYL